MPKPQFKLGMIYGNGKGIPQDYCLAYMWFSLAAVQGIEIAEGNRDIAENLMTPEQIAEARFNLGFMYENGNGIARDYAEAVRYYHLAAEAGHFKAQLYLGTMHKNGKGVTQDYAEAMKWYRLAAKAEDAEVQCNLGMMYEAGKGCRTGLCGSGEVLSPRGEGGAC